jgi:hypothetical protein
VVTVNLSEAEALALLRVLSPYVARFPKDASVEQAAAKIDVALLAHEENNVGRTR